MCHAELCGWVSTRDRLPNDGQNVLYYFKHVGMHLGVFNKIELPEEEVGEKGVFADCFSSENGFLCDEDMYWVPLPKPPK